MEIREIVPVFVVAIVFFSAAIIVGTVFLFLHRAKELKHQTIRFALERGQAVPPGLIEEGRPADPPRNDLSTGLKTLFLGVGIGLFFHFLGHPRLWAAGLIPGFIGVGYLAAHALTGRQKPPAPTAG